MFDALSQKISALFSFGSSYREQKTVDEVSTSIREALLEADVPVSLVDQFIEEVKTSYTKAGTQLTTSEKLLSSLHDKFKQLLGDETANTLSINFPSIIMMVGLQGSGKTTTIGKLATYFNEQAERKGKKRSILAVSLDFQRPGAIDQLEQVSRQAQIDFYRTQSTDVLQAAREIKDLANKRTYELIFVDTAGRLHVDTNLLGELSQVKTLIEPQKTFLVLDSMTGQESLRVAQTFAQSTGIEGAIFTKMDSNAKGGAILAFKHSVGKPIYFLGFGEKLTDLQPFHPDRIAKRIVGMGDLQTLLEQAEQKIKQSEQEALYKSIKKGSFTLLDFAQQMSMMQRLGSLQSIMKMMPGAAQLNMTPEMMEQGEKQLKKFKAILDSMTMKEKLYPKLLNKSRIQRITRGAGVNSQDITLLLERFEQSQQFAKLFKNMNGINRFFKQ
jgi:signal recognition particle subunit SRP54